MFSAPAFADIYQYIDEKGTVCLTNDRASVPVAKRKTAKVIREEQKSKLQPATGDPATSNSPGQHHQAPAVTTKSAAAQQTPNSPASPLKLGGIAAGMVGALLLISRLTRSLTSPQMARVIYVAFFLGTFVLGYKLYADHLVNGYFAIKSRMLTLFAKTQQREGLITPQPEKHLQFESEQLKQ